MTLERLAAGLREARGLGSKRDIGKVAGHFSRRPLLPGVAGSPRTTVPNGDDTAVIPDGHGHLLLAAEGLLPAFVRDDPWFAGFCSIMVNVNDVSAMGGWPIAVVDVVFAPESGTRRVLEGMQAAAEAFGVPIVGGHTGRAVDETVLTVAILGRARRLITSFHARPGHDLVLAVDLRGSYRGDGNYFNAATCASSARLRQQHALLPQLAELELVCAGKDVSMAGLAGTLAMLCETSGCGAVLELDAIPCPENVPLERWLLTFPSFGFLLSTTPKNTALVRRRFEELGVACQTIGRVEADRRIDLEQGGRRATFLDLDTSIVTGLVQAHEPTVGAPMEGPWG